MRLSSGRAIPGLWVLATVLFSPGLAAAADETVEEVLARHLEAKGGAAWEAIETLEITGRYTAYSVTKPFRLVRQRPNRYYFDRFENKQPVVTASDGDIAWWINPYYGIEHPFRMAQIDARYLMHRADFDCVLLRAAEREISIELLGEQDLEGSPAIVLQATRPDGAISTSYLDPETYLERAVMGTTGTWGFEAPSEIWFDDYREVDGAKIAFYREELAGDDDSIIEIDSVRTDVKLEEGFFAMPPPKAMLPLQALAGEWSVKVEQRSFQPDAPWLESAGRATFSRHSGGGLLLERLAYAGADGTPVVVVRQWTHDRFGERYRVTSHNDFSNQMKVLEGSRGPDGLVLDTLETRTTDIGRSGPGAHRRLTVTGIGSEEILVAIETSSDDGTTWEPAQRFTYTRID